MLFVLQLDFWREQTVYSLYRQDSGSITYGQPFYKRLPKKHLALS